MGLRHFLWTALVGTLASAQQAPVDPDFFPDSPSVYKYGPLKEALINAPAGVDCRTGPNVFMLWPANSDMFLMEGYGTLESVLFHYPDANVYIYNLPVDFFQRFQNEGYCVFSVPMDWNVIRDVLYEAQDWS